MEQKISWYSFFPLSDSSTAPSLDIPYLSCTGTQSFS